MELHGLDELTRGAAGLAEWRPCGHNQCPVWKCCGLHRQVRADWAECRTWGLWQASEEAARGKFVAAYLEIRRRKALRLAASAPAPKGDA